MIEPADTIERDGVRVEIVPDDDPGYGPQENDNAGTIYSWTRDFDGDRSIADPDDDAEVACDHCDGDGCPRCDGNGYVTNDLPTYMRQNFDAVLTIPLFFADYGSSGARIYVSDNPNCAICFTQKELDYEWSGSVDDATRYAESRISELDDYFRGNVYGLVARGPDDEVMESVWGFIGDLSSESGKYIREEANAMAKACAETVAAEKREAHEWACRDTVTV